MSISVFKTFSAGEVLTASDLNASLTQITTNGTDVAFPLTKNSSLGGFSLYFDAANTRSITDAAKGVNLAGTAFNDAKTTVASAASPDIWTSTGRLIDYTGTVTATGFAAASQAGAQRQLLCAAAAPFTAGANMLIDGYASGTTFTAAAGDVVDVIAVTTTQFKLKPRLYSGQPLSASQIAVCDFRITLTSGAPVTSSDVTGGTNAYVTPYRGNGIALYDGTSWHMRTSAEMSITGWAVSSCYDVFCHDNAGVPTLTATVWTNDTTRATALTTQDGVLVKSGDATKRYLGTLRTDGSAQLNDSLAKRHVWNYYNRVLRHMRVMESTDTWNYTTATWRQANASAANQLDFVIGVVEDPVCAQIVSMAKNTSANVDTITGIGFDSTSTAASGNLFFSGVTQVANQWIGSGASLKAYIPVGRHYFSWNEISAAVGTTTWAGDAGTTTSQSGIHGEIWG